MRFTPKSEEEEARAITRLVDESLSDTERPAVDEWASQQPEVKRQVASERRVADALRGGGPAPPDRLLQAIKDRVELADQLQRRSPAGWFGALPRWQPAVAGAAVVALCAVVAIVVIGIGSGGNSPSIPGAAKLAFAPSTGSAPVAKSAKLLDVSYGGVTYPNYSRFAVLPAGTRIDRIGGRQALTVFYRLPDGRRLSYTVFSGKPVPVPRDAKAVVFDGVPLHVFSTQSGLAVVTLVRFGRTCVLAAPTSQDAVLALAAAPVRAEAA